MLQSPQWGLYPPSRHRMSNRNLGLHLICNTHQCRGYRRNQQHHLDPQMDGNGEGKDQGPLPLES